MWKYLLRGVKCFFTKCPSVRSAGEEISIDFHKICFKHPLGKYSLYCIDAREGVLKNLENQSLFWQKCSLIFPIYISFDKQSLLTIEPRHDAHVSWFLWLICRAIKPIFVLLLCWLYKEIYHSFVYPTNVLNCIFIENKSILPFVIWLVIFTQKLKMCKKQYFYCIRFEKKNTHNVSLWNILYIKL